MPHTRTQHVDHPLHTQFSAPIYRTISPIKYINVCVCLKHAHKM